MVSENLDGRIAYYTMEIGIENDVKTYSGGLGVLAGDTIRSFADMGVPAVCVAQLNERGYCKQTLEEDGTQISEEDPWPVEEYCEELDVEVTVPIYGRDVTVTAWKYDVVSERSGHTVPIIYLDTNVESNDPEAREYTQRLYSPGYGEDVQLAQEIVLGIGGTRILDELGYEVDTYHMNEGHAALLTLELLKENDMDPEPVREQTVFTTHTPVEAGHDQFDWGLVNEVLGEFVPQDVLKKYSRDQDLHMTLLALNLSRYANSVAKKHQEVSQNMFPGYEIDAITNGVHVPFWVGDSFKELYDEYVEGWRENPYKLKHASVIPDDDLWEAHMEEKRDTIEFINEREDSDLDPEKLTIGFARRATAYKRADLIFYDHERLRHIAENVGEFQLVFAGKAFPGDQDGIGNIQGIFHDAWQLNDAINVEYVEGYDMEVGAKLTSGVDVWLNNPRRPLEACGTSGMKAAYNGIPQLGTLDGWWVEGHIENETGWKIGPEPEESEPDETAAEDEDRQDAMDMYDQLENTVVPMYYEDREKWTDIMRNTMSFNGPYYHTQRMVREYLDDAYSQ
ncbi:alpha-glucan family phosphorylase [Halapricum hydrolyticum]|uniref:Alpha-glucan family phosphorylase n=1 Tax=Halapricum hydrolyticum TaxID=2979991 RepID=A0AAE3LEJ8_9EURY|nr:alpha-glucan family phosphorylase [Halapricum hydrolyticum]MCU4717178.1 alpha-glucan family phosphorylase [Halapricum hydrolyticum]MCU4726105.1 alpha-glucan family phosphorylase [Halapricum hydrolyticum]